MNLRHTAALTLVGWYLMVPPNLAKTSWSSAGAIEGRILDAWIGSNKRMEDCTKWGKIAYFDTPFSQWSEIGVFDTYGQCEAQRGKNPLQKDNPTFPGPPSMQQRCVATADLEGNYTTRPLACCAPPKRASCVLISGKQGCGHGFGAVCNRG
jgi:hypothetical protein